MVNFWLKEILFGKGTSSCCIYLNSPLGYFDSELKPALEVDSGDTVTIETVSGGADVLPGPRVLCAARAIEIHDNVPRKNALAIY